MYLATALPLMFAQQEDAAAAIGAGIFMLIFGSMMLAALALVVLVFYIYYTSLAAIPQQYRTMDPGLVFLLLIPCFNVVWLFFIATKIPESFRNYFTAIGDHRQGDCGAGVGLAYAILAACGVIPYVGILTSLPAMICLIIFLVKLYTMKNIVLENQANGKFPPALAPAGMPAGGYYAGDPNNPYAPPGKQW